MSKLNCRLVTTKPMKIIIISSHAPALVGFRRQLIESLIAQSHEVIAMAPNFTAASRAQVSSLGASTVDCIMHRTGMNPLRDLTATVGLLRQINAINPDVTLGFFIKPVIFGTLASWLAGVPRRIAMVEGLGYVFTPIGEKLSAKRRLLKRLVMWLYRLAFTKAHRVVFLNPDDQNEFVQAKLLPRAKSYLLGGIGVDFSLWTEQVTVSDPVSFLLVARLLKEKGVLEYAAAARLVKAKHPQARFILLGGVDDNPGAITEADVIAWVSEGILEWHGHVPVQPWLAQASVFVLPSYREGVPCSTQEAMATGRAVITTDVPGCRETVVHGVNGFLVPPQNAQALAACMEHFIEQPQLIAQMGKESRRLAEQRFNVHEVNARLIKLLLGEQVEGESVSL